MRRPIFFSAYPKIFNLAKWDLASLATLDLLGIAKWDLLGIKARKSCYAETSGVMLPMLSIFL